MKDVQTPRFLELQDIVTASMKESGTPGVALGVFSDGVTETAGFGITSVTNPLEVKDTTLFQIGSITKTFTAMLVLQLVEEGAISLTAPVQDYLPDFRVSDEEVSSSITVGQLLTHTAGWSGDLFEDTGDGDDAGRRYMALMSGLAQITPPQTAWLYNNASFYLAGHLIEKVSGRTYETVLREKILDPIGLEDVYLKPGDVMLRRFAVGHDIGGEGPKITAPWPLPRAAWPAGGIVANIADLLRYARVHLENGVAADGRRLLTPTHISQLHGSQFQIHGSDEAIGLAWFVDLLDDTTVLHHSGATVGQQSRLLICPKRGFAMGVLTNCSCGSAVIKEVEQWVLHNYLSLSRPIPTPMAFVDSAALSELVGRYKRPFADLVLSPNGVHLQMKLAFKQGFPSQSDPPPAAPPAADVTLCESNRLVVIEGAMKGRTIDIIRGQDGSIRFLRDGGRIHARI